MQINIDKLKTALEIVKPGLASKEIIEQSTSFAFVEGNVVTFNDEISISHPVPDLQLTGAIRADELYQFLNRSTAKEIKVQLTGNEIVFKTPKSRAGLRLQSEISLPLGEIEMAEDFIPLPEGYVQAFKMAMNSTSSDASRPILTCIHLNRDYVEASDNFQLLRHSVDKANFPKTLIPATSVSALVKLKPTHVSFGESWAHFKNENDTLFSCRVLNDEFPHIDPFMTVSGVKVKFPDEMPEILERVRVFTKAEFSADETMEVIFDNGRITVKGSNGHGWFEERAKVQYKGDPVSFWIAPALLQNILLSYDECTVGENQIKFTGEGWQYVAMLKTGA